MLRNVLRDLCSKANIEGFHTNRSLRATTCSLALGKGVPEKLIMDRTGHRDVKFLHAYQRESGRERGADTFRCVTKLQELISRGFIPQKC